MKALKIVLIIAVVLVVVLMAAAFIFIKTFDLNSYKPQIISRASKALGRPVDFSRVDMMISLRRGVNIRLTDLRVGEDPAFAEGDFLAVKEVYFGVDALGYIFHKKLNIPSVFISEPRITLIRSGDGSINLNKIGRVKEKGEDRDISIPAVAKLPVLFISSVKTTRGSLTYIDRLFKPALTLKIKNLSLEASRISLTDPFPFSIEAAAFSDQTNVFLDGDAAMDLQRGELTISVVNGTTDLSRLLLEQIARDLPMTKNFSLPVSLKGKVGLSLQRMTVGAKGLTDLSADVSLQDASLKFKEVASALQEVAINARVTEKDVFFEKFSARMAKGRITAHGSIDDYVFRQNYKIEANAEDIDLTDLIAQDKAPVSLSGIASCQLTLNGQGLSPSNINSNLSGQAKIVLLRLMLKDINVLHTVLDKISVIPGLSEDIKANLPERFKQKLIKKDTIFSDVRLPVTIANGRLAIMDAVLKADGFTFRGHGEAGFNGAFTLEGAFLIPRDLSKAMVAAADELQYLLNRDNQIYIPLKVSGSATALTFYVDAAYMANKLLIEQGKRQILKVIDKALGQEEESIPPQEGPDTQKQGPVEEKEPTTEEQVKDLLRDIFR